MARSSSAPSKMEILVLSSLAREPMHGYEIKLELRYKHVRWWAKCDHGHLYGTLTRLERRGFIRLTGDSEGQTGRPKKVYEITAEGRTRLLQTLEETGLAEDRSFFDVDVFLSGSFLLEQPRVLEILAARREKLTAQLQEANELRRTMSPYVPAAGHLIMEHRARHLAREIEFTDHVVDALGAQTSWGSFLQGRSIGEHLEVTGAPLED